MVKDEMRTQGTHSLTKIEEIHLASTLNDYCPICMSIRSKLLNKHFPEEKSLESEKESKIASTLEMTKVEKPVMNLSSVNNERDKNKESNDKDRILRIKEERKVFDCYGTYGSQGICLICIRTLNCQRDTK